MNPKAERINREVAVYGFSIVEAPATSGLKYGYHYTVGLYRLGFSELLISNVDQPTAIATINHIVQTWQAEESPGFDKTQLESLPALIPLHPAYMPSYMPEMFARLPDVISVRKPLGVVQALLLGNPRDVFKTRKQ